jgi:hypothetical protein
MKLERFFYGLSISEYLSPRISEDIIIDTVETIIECFRRADKVFDQAKEHGQNPLISYTILKCRLCQLIVMGTERLSIKATNIKV